MATGSRPSINPLNVFHPDYQDQLAGWTKMEDLYLGADKVKSKGAAYLPTTSVEDEEIKKVGPDPNKVTSYSRRLQHAVFFNGISRLVRYAMGHVFRVDPLFEGSLPSQFDQIKKDCDLMGTPLTAFIRANSDKSYLFGHHIVMVDFPNTTGIDSRAVQKMVNPRPYLVPVHPIEIINWSISRSLDGTFEYDWLVHRYSLAESDGPTSAHVTAVYYKIWTRTKWELWRIVVDSPNSDFNQITPEKQSEGVNTLGMVPYVSFYSNFVRPMVSQPPLEEAAALNLNHYNIFSLFLHGLRHHLNPIFVTTGTQDQTIKRDAASGLALPRGATAEYVETAGHGMKIALDTSDRVANEMWEAGMRSSAAVGANTSAEARKLSRSDFFSFLTALVGQQENAWARVFKLISLWSREDLTNDRPVKLNEDFDTAQLEANQSEFLLNARKAGEISKKLFMNELVRGGVFKQDLNVDEELVAAAADLQEDLKALAEAEAIANAGSDAGPGATKPPEKTSEKPVAAGS